MNGNDIDPANRQAAITIAVALVLLAGTLFVVTRFLHFKFVVGVGD